MISEIIAEKIVKELNRLILEELGIADDVRQITNELMPQIKDAVASHLKDGVYTDRLGEPFDSYVKESSSTVTTTAFEQRLAIDILNFNFPNKELYEQCYNVCGEALHQGKGGRTDRTFMYGSRLIRQNITIWTVTISGGLLMDKAKDTLQHEISHLYEQFRADKPYERSAQYSNSMNKLNDGDYLTSCIAHILYYAGAGEITAFTNGLYAELGEQIQQGKDLTKELLFNSSTYKDYLDLCKRLEYVSNQPNNGKINSILKGLGSSLRQGALIALGNKVERRLLTAIGKVWVKVQNDYFGENLDPRMRQGFDNSYAVK